MAFTPGPWRIERNHAGMVFGIMAPESAKNDLDLICGMYGQMVQDDNAKLIAAAPDLLAACEAALKEAARPAAARLNLSDVLAAAIAKATE